MPIGTIAQRAQQKVRNPHKPLTATRPRYNPDGQNKQIHYDPNETGNKAPQVRKFKPSEYSVIKPTIPYRKSPVKKRPINSAASPKRYEE